MKKRLLSILTIILTASFLTGCGEDPALTKFKTTMDEFCTEVSNIDDTINNIDPDSESAVETLLMNLDNLDDSFKKFAAVEFPDEFKYLEHTADEASDYMTKAVSEYHDAYSNGSYNEYTAEYAAYDYECACNRIKIIISFMHGETPDGVVVE